MRPAGLRHPNMCLDEISLRCAVGISFKIGGWFKAPTGQFGHGN